MAYRLALPPSLSEMHDVFHVSQLRKFIPDPLQPVLQDTIEIEADLTFEPLPSRIVGRETKVLRNKEIPLVKVQWDMTHPGDATWELESEMRDAYPHLFQVNILNSWANFYLRGGGCNTPYLFKHSNYIKLTLRY